MLGFATTSLIAILLPAGPFFAPPQEDERLYITEAPEELLRQWEEAEEKKDWKKLVELHTLAAESFADHLCQPDEEDLRWIRLPRFLSDRLSTMPDGPREAHETVARQLFERLRDPVARRAAMDRYGFTDAAHQAVEAGATRAFDEGRVREAVRGWLRVLDRRPSPLLVARIATAFAALNDRPGLEALKARVAELKWKGDLTIGGRKQTLGRYLATLEAAPPALRRPPEKIRATNEVPLGNYALHLDGGKYGTTYPTARPAYAKWKSKEYVVITNGIRVTVINPARAAGGTLSPAVEWHYPTAGTVRGWMPGGRGPLPSVGAAVGDGRAYVTMFSTAPRYYGRRVGRQRDNFDGPSCIRAFELDGGKLLWDTDSVEIEVDGRTEPMIESLPFGRKNFCFAGPPIRRGDRLYVLAMTSPLSVRECWLLCLNAADGTPRWYTSIASAPPRRGPVTVPTVTEEGGQLVVQTNFGVIASLDAGSGGIDWLVKYESLGGSRPVVNAPVFYGSRVAVLAQDRDEALIFDRWSGKRTPLPELSLDIPWTRVRHLIGRVGGWTVVSGEESFAIRTADGRVIPLLDADTSKSGRGVIHEGRVYLPLREYLQVYDASTWKLVRSHRWPEVDSYPGNLLVSGGWCVFLSSRLSLSTSRSVLDERFKKEVAADPPRPHACRQFAQIMETSGRLDEAIRYYTRALSVWEKDPAWEETAEGIRKKLEDLKDRLGAPPPKEE